MSEPARASESIGHPRGEIDLVEERFERDVKRIGLLRTVIVAVVILVSSTATAVSGYTIHRAAKLEERVEKLERRDDWIVFSIYEIAQKVGAEKVPRPPDPKELP